MCGRFSMSAVRPSIEERYGTTNVRDTAELLVRGRYPRQDDADRLIAQTEASRVLK